MASPITTRYHLPSKIAIFAIVTAGATYPAVWNQDRAVRQIASTVLVLGMVAMVISTIYVVRRWVDDVDMRNKPHRARQLVQAMVDELNDPEWNDLARRMSMGEMPTPDDDGRN